MTKACLVISFVLASVLVVAANTVVDQVGGEAVDSFGFTSVGGTYEVSITWLNSGADLVAAMVCDDGVDDPIPFGAAAAGHQRIAVFKAGVPAGVVCAVAVTAIQGGSKYWLSIRREADESTRGVGRGPGLPTARPLDAAEAHRAARRQVERLKNVVR